MRDPPTGTAETTGELTPLDSSTELAGGSHTAQPANAMLDRPWFAWSSWEDWAAAILCGLAVAVAVAMSFEVPVLGWQALLGFLIPVAFIVWRIHTRWRLDHQNRNLTNAREHP